MEQLAEIFFKPSIWFAYHGHVGSLLLFVMKSYTKYMSLN
jgi:hypothetical protein